MCVTGQRVSLTNTGLVPPFIMLCPLHIPQKIAMNALRAVPRLSSSVSTRDLALRAAATAAANFFESKVPLPPPPPLPNSIVHRRSFSKSASNGASIYDMEKHQATDHGERRTRFAANRFRRHHPIADPCILAEKDVQNRRTRGEPNNAHLEKRLRQTPRYTPSIFTHEFDTMNRLRDTHPRYAPYLSPSVVEHFPWRYELEDALRGKNIYEASEFLDRCALVKIVKWKRIELYKELWRRSVDVEVPDLPKLLAAISTWLRCGVQPCNLYSEAFSLLLARGAPPPEAVVLCLFYRGISKQQGLPSDDDFLPVAEDIMLAHMPSFSMEELMVSCQGFFRTYVPFGRHYATLTAAVEERFRQLLLDGSHSWETDTHSILKLLKINDGPEPMYMLPALEAAGFFSFCLDAKLRHSTFGLHELNCLMAFYRSRDYRDDDVVRRCLETTRVLVERRDFFDKARGKDVACLLLHYAHLSVKLDDDVIDAFIEYFRRQCIPVVKTKFGESVHNILDAAFLLGVYPHDLIHAFFSCQKFMRLENGKLPGMTDDGRRPDPWEQLLRLDFLVGIMCPDYTGARLPDEVKDGVGMGRTHLCVVVTPKEIYGRRRRRRSRKACPDRGPGLNGRSPSILDLILNRCPPSAGSIMITCIVPGRI